MLSRQVIDLIIGGEAPVSIGNESAAGIISSVKVGGGGDPVGLVSAMGYEKKFEYVYKGDRFRRGAVVVEVYRLFEVGQSTSIRLMCSIKLTYNKLIQSIDSLIPLDSTSYVVSLTNKIIPRVVPSTTNSNSNSSVVAQPVTSAQELKTEAMGRMREMVNVLRGLVDLQRIE